MSNKKISTQTIESAISALSEIRDGLEEQVTYDDENDCWLECQELTDRDFIVGLINNLEDRL
jgi:hypothetical protein